MRKKSAKKAAENFISSVTEIEKFVAAPTLSSLSKKHVSWAHDYAVIRLYRDFEDMILNCLIAAINSNTAELSNKTGVDFPKHLTDEVCEYIIVGDGYFDFRGRDGLIGTIKKYVDNAHYLVDIVKRQKYREALERLSALRNFAAHDSKPSKNKALEAVGLSRMESAGAWLKKQERFSEIASKLKALAQEIQANAPY